ncbi:MAG: ChaN family lipoprotein [Flavobacteriales bacterium]|nr:ChaN family lipoprotein [Flavobacteriales bacterium]
MKIALTTCISALLITVNGFSQKEKNELKAYQFYASEGSEITFGKAVEEMAACDIVLFGELHDNAMIHWLQLKMAQELSKIKSITLGGEMFETDNQLLMDEYLMGLVNDSRFEAEARLWPNYKTDYKPLLQLAREKNLRFIATNVPRRYAALVSQQGLDTLNNLSAEARKLLPKLRDTFNLRGLREEFI